jgi:hypothetical protein
VVAGSYQSPATGVPPISKSINTYYDYVSDVTGPGDGQLFTAIQQRIAGSMVVDYIGPPGGKSYNYPWIPDATAASWAHAGVAAGQPTNAQMAAKILADTNPSRADADLIVDLFDIGDLPRTINFAGNNLLKKLANGNLSVRFGLIPLVSDLTALLNFVDLTNKRFQELKALQERGLKRRRNLWSGSGVYTQKNVGLATELNPPIFADLLCTQSVKLAGFVEWYPTNPRFPLRDDELMNIARRAVYGITLDASTAWEAIPFTWLSDWFSNVGDLMMANRNLIPCTHSVPQIMQQTVTETQYTVTSTTSYSALGQKVIGLRTSKQRTPTSATLSASIPMLTPGNWSILASLAILKSGHYD